MTVDVGRGLLAQIGPSKECVAVEMERHGEQFAMLELQLIKELKGNSKCFSQLASFISQVQNVTLKTYQLHLRGVYLHLLYGSGGHSKKLFSCTLC